MTVPTLYYHHANKQALLVALLDEAMEVHGRVARVARADPVQNEAAER